MRYLLIILSLVSFSLSKWNQCEIIQYHKNKNPGVYTMASDEEVYRAADNYALETYGRNLEPYNPNHECLEPKKQAIQKKINELSKPKYLPETWLKLKKSMTQDEVLLIFKEDPDSIYSHANGIGWYYNGGYVIFEKSWLGWGDYHLVSWEYAPYTYKGFIKKMEQHFKVSLK